MQSVQDELSQQTHVDLEAVLPEFVREPAAAKASIQESTAKDAVAQP